MLIAEALKKLVHDSGIHSRDVYINLQESQVYTRVINMPVLTEQELENAIEFEAEQYIPIPMDEVYLEKQVLFTPPPGAPDRKMEVLLVAAKKQAVEQLVRISQLAELTPLVIETSLLSTIRSLRDQLLEYSLLVDIGNSSTDVAIIQENYLKQTNSIPTGGEALVRSVAQNLSLPEKQAKEYIRTYGMDTTQLEGKIAQAMQEPITTIINQIVKNIRFTKSLGTDGHVDQVILSGGTALMPNLINFLVEQLNIEVNLANPLQNCQNKNLPQQLITAAPRFASVIGLAMRD